MQLIQPWLPKEDFGSMTSGKATPRLHGQNPRTYRDLKRLHSKPTSCSISRTSFIPDALCLLEAVKVSRRGREVPRPRHIPVHLLYGPCRQAWHLFKTLKKGSSQSNSREARMTWRSLKAQSPIDASHPSMLRVHLWVGMRFLLAERSFKRDSRTSTGSSVLYNRLWCSYLFRS